MAAIATSKRNEVKKANPVEAKKANADETKKATPIASATAPAKRVS